MYDRKLEPEIRATELIVRDLIGEEMSRTQPQQKPEQHYKVAFDAEENTKYIPID